MIEILQTIGLVALGVVFLIGIFRVMFSPYQGFWNLIFEAMLIDYLVSGVVWVFECICEIWDND